MKRFIRIILLVFFSVALIFLLLNLIFPLQFKIDYSQVVTAENGVIIHAYLNKDEKWRMKAELHEISPQLKKAFLYKEDKHFYYHPGVDPFAMARAVANNVLRRQKTSGASTITMQVARLLYPAKRTYYNKIREIFRAFQLELLYSKEEIFALYLNLAPYGGNIEGVKAASLLYYGRTPDMLSLSQAVTLTIIPNRPTSLRPGKNNTLLEKEKNKWLKRLSDNRIFPQEEIANALTEPVTIRRIAAPADAPQLSARMIASYPSLPVIRTTISALLQKKAETITYNYIQRLKLINVHNAAVLVIENKTGNVSAYVGSADFGDAMHGGEVDGIAAIRSPGSTLKPLVYALAIDKGLITPKTIIDDIPVNFAGYKPENFNSRFNGKVTAEKALAYSLNIPAVKLLDETGVAYFTGKLRQAGFATVARNSNNMGLSMVLGGCGVSLFELGGLYCAFANEGIYRPLKLLAGDTTRLSSPVISPAATFMIDEILTMPVRPDLPNNYESSMHVPKIAWKTGTSYGRRDAWSIGFNKKYTIAVWVGNFDGTGVPELTGADMATPLLFNLFNSLDYNSGNDWFVPPAMLDFRLVCSESGLPPGEDCTDQVSDYFIPGISAYKKCTHLKEVFVSADEKFSYCMRCLPEAGYKKKKFPNEDPALLAWYRSNHVTFHAPPPHNPSCTRVFSESPPRITSPVNEKEYLVQKGQQEELELKCIVPDDVAFVYWYINNVFFRKSKPDESVFFVPVAGTVKISCSDDQGRNSNCTIRITNY